MSDEISSSFVRPGAQPLFEIPCPVIVVSGPHGSGKTVLGVTLCPEDLLLFDEEESSASYKKLPIKKRVAINEELLKKFPGGSRPVDLFLWWQDQIRAIKPGEYRMVMVDPVSEIETGLADWVRANPKYFGVTAEQYARMSALVWGHVKSYWKRLLLELAAKVELVYLTVHLKAEWQGKEATGRKIPKGLETLEELASLYLILDRSPDKQTGVSPEAPRAKVHKHRLSSFSFDAASRTYKPKPIMPPRLAEVTWPEIHRYMAMGGLDYNNLKPEEMAQLEVLTDEEKLDRRLQIATKQAEAEQARLAYQETSEANKRAQRAEIEARRNSKQSAAPPAPAISLAPAPAPSLPPPAPPTPPPVETISVPQLEEIIRLKDELAAHGWGEDRFKAAILRRNVTDPKMLPPQVGAEFILSLAGLLTRMQAELQASRDPHQSEAPADAASKS